MSVAKPQPAQVRDLKRDPGRVVRWLLLLSCLWFVGSAPARAAGDANLTLMAAVHLKILSFDRAIDDDPSKPLVVGVAWVTGAARSRDQAVAIAQALEFLGQKKQVTVHGRPVRAELIEIPAGSSQFVRGDLDALFVTASVVASAPEMIMAAHSAGVGTLCDERSSVEAGVAVGVLADGGKPQILVDLSQSRDAGMRLDPRLLSLAEVIE